MNASGLRVALVGPLPPPAGGIANQTKQLAALLREAGATVQVVRVNHPYRPSWIANLRCIREPFRLLPYLVELWRAADRAQLFHVMANSGWSWHLVAAPAIWIAALKGKPVVLNYRGGEAEAFFKKSFFWVRPSLKRVDTIIVPSGFLDAVFRKRGFAPRIVPNIIDLSRFNLNLGVDENSLRGSPCIIVPRNLEPIYDNATALRAFRIIQDILPGVRLVIVGSGPERQTLENLAIELGVTDAVTFTGRVDNEAMMSLYRNADLVLNPSLVDNMPISILEAMASGVPVVSTDVGGIPYLVEHGRTAWLVPAQEPQAMAEACIQLLKDPTMAQKIKDAGIEDVKQYAWQNVRGRLFEVYNCVLNKAKNSWVANEEQCPK